MALRIRTSPRRNPQKERETINSTDDDLETALLSPTKLSNFHEDMEIDLPPPAAPTMSPSPSRPSGRERRNPSITPRKFTRFFTPRIVETTRPSSSRRALIDITQPALNETSPARTTRRTGILDSSPPPEFPRDLKRRKVFHTPDATPDSKEHGYHGRHSGESDALHSSPCERSSATLYKTIEEEPPVEAKRIVPLRSRGFGGQILERNHGSTAGRFGRQHHVYPVNDWQDHTAPFHTRPNDVHISMSIEGDDRTIPFCATSCNTNTLVAVGDEEGRVRLLETAYESSQSFKDVFLSFRVHTNAIIDMHFSADDTRLATASGDQSARVVDMGTQTTLSILGNHTASLKQVRFQPGSRDVVATSSRDGSIQIWDLRCKGYEQPLVGMYAPIEVGRPMTRLEARKTQYGRVINSIEHAHKPQSRQSPAIGVTDAPIRGEVAGRVGDVSVTAIQFLPTLPHLLLSASEADASVRLWDIRRLPTKKKNQVPLSATQQPQSHSKWRHFGLSSLNLSSDGSRFYTLCKDNTVYAYSTSHLILGQAPKLSLDTRPNPQKETAEGLGPLYGFRHPQLHATSFYVKSAVRKAKDGKCEMLAVGSSDGCAVLFPTDERYLPLDQPKESVVTLARPTLRRVGSGLSTRHMDDSIPITTNGTPLIRGHDREVGSLTWTHDGNLVTVGDDFLVRCWREGDAARDLRMGGESGGRRWGVGGRRLGRGLMMMRIRGRIESALVGG